MELFMSIESEAAVVEPIMEMSNDITAISKVLPKAQAAMGDVIKGATNPAFRSKYADLGAVIEAVIPALNGLGIALLQPTAYDGNNVKVATMLLHESGQWLRCTLAMPLSKRDAHGVGSAITYGRRYGLMAVAGVAPEDDDGNAAVAGKAPARPAPVANGRLSAAEAKRQGEDAKAKANIESSDLAGLLEWTQNFDAWTAHLPASWLDSIRDMIEHRREALLNPAADAEAEMDQQYADTIGRAA